MKLILIQWRVFAAPDFLAGEVLNIDGVTGGFNFQNGWTTGWIAGNSWVSDNFTQVIIP